MPFSPCLIMSVVIRQSVFMNLKSSDIQDIAMHPNNTSGDSEYQFSTMSLIVV